ncbi:MAG: hypothetical protein QOG43_2213 [Actinomycetota bacterium]|jgi:membrane-associated phospholipid phosphatase|nr:hypothetical protein [Actinomycetota bacterium]
MNGETEVETRSPIPLPRLWLTVVAVLAGLVFLALTFAVWRSNEPIRTDRVLYRWMFDLGLTGRRGLLRSRRLSVLLADLGSPAAVGLLAMASVGLALLWRDRVGAAVALLGPTATIVVTELVAKPVINQPVLGPGRVFPSGHAAGLAAAAIVLVLVLHRHRGRVASLPVAPMVLAAVAAMGVSAVRLGRHYPTDVVGGVALAMAVVLGLMAIGSKFDARRSSPTP